METARKRFAKDAEFYRSIMHSLPFNLAVIDREGNIVETNESWAEFGRENGLDDVSRLDDSRVQTNYLEVCRQSDDKYAEQARQGIESVISGERKTFTMEYPCHGPDSQGWYIMQVYRFQHGDDYFIVNHVDITGRKLSEKKNNRLSSIVENIPVCIMTLKHPYLTDGDSSDQSGLPLGSDSFFVTDFNPHAETVTGISHVDVLGKSYEEVFEAVFGENLRDELSEVVRSKENYEADAVVTKDGPLEGRCWDLKVFNITSDHMAVLFEDVTEEVKNREKLQYLAAYDGLTGLPNRNHLLEEFRKEFSRAKRYENDLSFLLLDLDEFKRINDTYGHIIGDTVLERLGDLIEKETRDSDMAGRYGGEEFGIVLTETPEEEACRFANRLCDSVRELDIKSDDDEKVDVTASIGVSELKSDDKDIQDILRRTDESLYEAKNSGRDRVVC